MTAYESGDRVEFWAGEAKLPAGTRATVATVHRDDMDWVEVLLDDGRRFAAFEEVLEPVTDTTEQQGS